MEVISSNNPSQKAINTQAEMASVPLTRARNKSKPRSASLNLQVIKQGPDEQPSTEIMSKLIQFYSDDGRMKRAQKVQNDKLYKHLTCCEFLPVLSPDGLYVLLWKVWIMVLSIFYVYEIPVYVCFGYGIYNTHLIIQEEYGMTVTDLNIVLSISILFFICDMFLNFITAYFLHGNPVTKHGKIALNYLKTDFIFDLLAYLVLLIRLLQADDHNANRWVYFFFYLRLPAIIKIDNHLEEIFLLRRELRLFHMVVRILITIFACINFYCCIFYAMGHHFYNKSESTWLNNNGNFGIIGERPYYQAYFFSFYFSLGTLSSTMGYGDVSPMNLYECSWALLGMMFGIMVFIFNMNVIYDYVQEYNDVNRGMVRDKIAIHRFLRDKKVSSTTKSRINQYLNEFWYAEGRRDFGAEQRVLDWLGPELKGQVLFEAYSPFITSVPYFKKFGQQLIYQLSLSVRELRMSKGEHILRDKTFLTTQNDQQIQVQTKERPDPKEDPRNQVQFAQINGAQGSVWIDQDCLYFIQMGSVNVHPTLNTNKIVLEKLKQGQTFGEWGFITGLPRQSSITTVEYSHLQYIRRQDFLDIIQKFPKDYEIFCMIKDQMILNQRVIDKFSYFENQLICYTCLQPGHMATRCPYSHYEPSVRFIEQQNGQVCQVRRRVKRPARRPKSPYYALINQIEIEDAAFRCKNKIENNTLNSQTIKGNLLKSQRMQTNNANELQESSALFKRQKTILLGTQQGGISKQNKAIFDQIDEPKNFEHYYPNHNMNALVQVYNNYIEDYDNYDYYEEDSINQSQEYINEMDLY